ncbi:MAG: glutaredoxin 3 [Pseudorhodoplanes sp.]|jgi:glutaredoxin 3|nr:glutaredoxin 3 [Pseudorhodoplanes sp.]
MSSIEIYTTPYCPYCGWAKELLGRKGVDYTEIDVSGDRDLRAAMTQRALGRTTVPQIFIGDTHIGGCDDLYALDEAGKLDPLLAQVNGHQVEPQA